MDLFSLMLVVSASTQTSTPTPVAQTAPTPGEDEIGLRVSKDVLLVPSISYRPRYYAHTGRDFADGDNASVVSHRARVGLDVKHSSGLRIFTQIQDVRVWGEEEGAAFDFNAGGLDVFEFYADIPIYDRMVLRAGRQELNLDAKRLISSLPWAQRGIKFNGLKLSYKRKKYTFQTFGFRIQEADQFADGNVPAGRTDDHDLVGAHLNYKGKTFTGSVLYLFRAQRDADIERHTTGVFFKGTPDLLQYEGEFYYQFGDLSGETISSYLATLDLRRSFTAGSVQPFAAIHGTIIGGDGTAEGAFDTLYALNHKYYGEMDFFLNIPRHTSNLGLIDLGGEIGARAGSVLASITVQHFRPVESASDNLFGHEIDAKVKWTVSPNIYLRGVLGVFFPGDLMGAINTPPAGTERELVGFVTLNTQI